MPFIPTPITDLWVFEPRVFKDERGYFFEAFNKKNFGEININIDFVQDNQSYSSYGVIRGLHYQLQPFAQAKLVRVLAGEILDVAVDIRKNSPTYGQHFSITLSAENKKQLFIPHGFAHGFSVLSPVAEVMYKCDQYYSKADEGGIIYNDAALAINWQIPDGQQIISEKDIVMPGFENCLNNF